ncbi:DEAD/DEAH box helicase [Brevibacillus daliensis]|uniref:DEAD/DEAH box helicase n=1 Tax=Brevibacillus daliensis TaxID=2892995 RepID=UPI001E367CF9|nr:DEAD/DEAH box helicase [Brevibacillus daliensis]
MSFRLTHKIIKVLCGRISYERGKAYHRAQKVMITSYDPDVQHYEATIYGKDSYNVTVNLDRHGNVNATCSCPSLSTYEQYCQHVAAVLISMYDMHQTEQLPMRIENSPESCEGNLMERRTQYDLSLGEKGNTKSITTPSGISEEDIRLTNRILGLFEYQPSRPSGNRSNFDTREVLDVEFICKPFHYGYRKYMFGIELKVGPKRLYIVQKLRDFLISVEQRKPYLFTKHFTYDPKLHSFQKENDAIIGQLIQIMHNEKMLRETASDYSVHVASKCGERMLLIPPFSWEKLLPLFRVAPTVKLEHDDRTFDGIHLSDEQLPLQFEFHEAETEGYQLEVQGLKKITVMESYGVILSEGKILKSKPEQCNRLAEIKQMLESSRKHQILIAPEQMEPFMEKVIPGLIKLGNVHIDQTVSERLVQTPLKARLYLDRIRERLLAGLEFQYGDIILNPLEGNDQKRGTDLILMRDGEKERRILELMEQSSFVTTESGYFMEDEEAEYEFLYHIVPQLEKLLKVYVSSAVKVRLHTGNPPPKVTVDVDKRTEWLEFSFDMGGIPDSEIRNLLKSLEEKRRFYKMPDGALMPLEGAEFQQIVRMMNELGVHYGDVKGSGFRLPVIRGLHVIDSHEQGKAVKLGKSFRRLLENMRNPDNLEFPLPKSLAPILRDYQVYGYQWMKTLAHYRFGGILADEMGLGKTLQSISFIVSILPEIREQQLPALIIAPTSLVYNWQNELKKFAPEIRTVIADGTKEERSHVLHDLSHVDALITSYPLLRRDIEMYANHSFHTLILDEAQFFKNHTTQTAQAVKLITAKYRFALTGTPVENSLEELWSIYDAVFPELFRNKKTFHNITRENVAKRIRPFMLRRLKVDVLRELPDKIETIQTSALLADQKKLYAAYLAKLQQETLKHLNEDGFQKHRIKILAGLTRLRQLCCHPALFVEDYEGSSAKFEQLLALVEDCRSAGRRMLVFSQFTQMLDLIGRELGYQGVPFFYLDGKTPASERVELCNRFNEGERDVFLISLKAGGNGLNLTGADTVILYDLWWNPAVEQQATDRAHRIGQKNVVQVIRFITQGTVEEKMYELQQKKKNMIEEIIQPGEEAISTLTEEDIREILMM